MTGINFKSIPQIGTRIMLDDQAYQLAASEPYRRKDGSASHLLVWHTECPKCSQGFMLKTGLVSVALNRRCEVCRKRTRSPVSGKRRGKKVAVKVLSVPTADRGT